MPIKDFSDRVRPVRGGHIRLGFKQENQRTGKEYPVKSDHFIPDFTDDYLTQEFERLYGKQPREIQICFHSDSPNDVFPQNYKCYGRSTGLKCIGDGETARRANPETGEMEEVDCPTPEHCEFSRQHGCKQQGSLMFFIKGMPTWKVFQINTTSWNSMLNVNTAIKMLALMRRNRTTAGIWLKLRIVPKEVTVDNKKQTVFVLELDLPPGIGIENAHQLTSMLDEPGPLGLPGPMPEVKPGDIVPDDTRDELLYPTDGHGPQPGPEPKQTEDSPAKESPPVQSQTMFF